MECGSCTPARSFRLASLAAAVLVCGASVSSAQSALDSADAAAFTQSVQPLLAKYCVSCHGGSEPEGHLALDAFPDAAAAVAKRKIWDRVQEYVRGGVMPPEGEPQPTPQEAEQLNAWIESTFSKLDCTLAGDPGRVTIRRLNRAEYNNTVRDLVGIDFQPANDFPTDDVGYGFDNIGDVLSLPPLLLEKYLAAAEQVSQKAIVVPDGDKNPKQRFEAEEMKGGGNKTERHRAFWSEAEIETSAQFVRDGQYRIKVEAYGDQAGGEPAKMRLWLDGKEIKTFDVPAEEDEPGVYEHTMRIEAGTRKLKLAFVNDYYQAGGQKQDRNLYVDFVEIAGPLGAAPDAQPESYRRIVTRQPKGGDELDCAREILTGFAGKAYRRPVAPEEVERLVRFVDMALKDGASFDRGLQLAVQATLVSPYFLFRVELDEGQLKNGSRDLNDFELAARLSYFLWSSMPDEQLFRHAREGTLRSELEHEVRRMLIDPKARSLVENFAGQWLQIRNLKSMTPDAQRFPTFNDALRSDMKTETEMFFETVMREDRSVLEFLDADYTFLNDRLAKHYKIDGVQGDRFRRVALSGDQRGGLLSQASILTVTSNPTRTSPVKRGKWVLENLLGEPPPPPPPGVTELSEDEQIVLSGTLRQRMEQHRSNANCAVCHSRLDPLGFGLENYDAVGAWRTEDGKFPIDSSGDLPDGLRFQGPRELKGILLTKRDQFTRCLTEKMLTYALGRGLETSDNCEVDRIAQRVKEDDYKFSRLVVEIVAGDSFQKRQAPGGTP